MAAGQLKVSLNRGTRRSIIDGDKSHLSQLWAFLRNARVFSLQHELWHDLQAAMMDAVVYPHAQNNDPDIGPILDTKAADLGFPKQLPFDYCFLGFDKPIELDAYNVASRMDKATITARRNLSLSVQGYLITHHGHVVEYADISSLVIDGPNNIRTEEGLAAIAFRDPEIRGHIDEDGKLTRGPWENSTSMIPWMIHGFIDLINDNHTIVRAQKIGTVTHRKVIKAELTGSVGNIDRPVPPPFYTVRMKDKTLVEQTARRYRVEGPPKMTYAHQFDVRGHERVKVYRGPLPIDPEDEMLLQERDYKIYTDKQPSDMDADRLLRRRMPRKHDSEWVAIKIIWVNSYKKGPEDTPYIPSVRTMDPVGQIKVSLDQDLLQTG